MVRDWSSSSVGESVPAVRGEGRRFDAFLPHDVEIFFPYSVSYMVLWESCGDSPLLLIMESTLNWEKVEIRAEVKVLEWALSTS